MTTSEILRNLHDRKSPRYEAAWAALLTLLTRMAARTVVAGRAHGCTIPEEEREDIVGDVLAQVLAKSPLAVAEVGDGASYEYLRRMLGNRWISIVRRRRHEQPPLDAPEGDPPRGIADVRADPVMDELIDEQRRAALLETLFDEHLSRRKAHYREATREAWNDLKFLVFEGGSMNGLVDEAVGPDASEADRIKARNRVFTQSKRLRLGLADAISVLRARGRLGADDAIFAKESLLRLMRCQRAEPAHVAKGTKGAAMTAGDRKLQRSEGDAST